MTARYPRRGPKRIGMLALAVLAALFCGPTAKASVKDSVKITVAERAGVARVAEYVTFGIPIPRQWKVTDISRLRLLDASGKPVPAQFEALARWSGRPADLSAPVKWVLVGYLESIAAGAAKTLVLDASGPAPASATKIQIDTKTTGKMIVDTGAAKFELNTNKDFNLFNQVTVGGKTLLQPLATADAIVYKPAGKLSLVAGGKPDLKPRVTAAVVERAGPLCAVVRVTGSILDGQGRALLDFTARLHFVAGRSDVRLDFTVENNHPIIEAEHGQPANAHKQGAVNSVYIGELKLNLRLKKTAEPVGVLTEQNVKVVSPKSAVRLYQDSSGTDNWNVYLGLVGWPKEKASANPRLQSYCTKKGYEITGEDLPKSLTGSQAIGWMTAYRGGEAGPRLTVAVRDFWQNFPKAIEAAPDGTVSVNLFPNGNQFKHNFRIGEEKTHTILLHFALGQPSAKDSEQLAKAFNRPLFGAAPAAWYVASGALGEAPAADLKRWPLYERYVRVAFEPNPDFDPSKDDPNQGNRTLRQVVEHYNFYGWQDYGDVPLDYEASGPKQAGQMNLKYWYLYGMLVQFCRSGEMQWLDLARPAAWHLADIDYLHIPDEGPQHWCHGAYFGHSTHDEPGNRNPNRNYNSPSVDLFYGTPDLLLAYYLTGERRFREVALEGLQAMVAQSQFSDFAHPIPQRERANLIFAYIEAYRQTGDARWMKELKKIVGHTADIRKKQWLTDPAGFGKTHPDEFVKMFSFSQVLWTMGRYLDFCAEYGIKDDLGVAKAIDAYAEWMLKFAMKEYAPGRATTLNEYRMSGNTEGTYLEINNWTLTMADVLAYAYKYSAGQDKKKFLDAAAKFYASGTIDPVWKNDPPVFISTKDLVNSCNWGLVYMNQHLQSTGK